MPQNSPIPLLPLLAQHWLSMGGAALVTAAVIAWLLAVLTPGGHGGANPYAGLLIFFAIPAVFFIGLLMIPAGVWLAKRRIRSQLDGAAFDRPAAVRRLAIFLAITTLANIVLASQFTYRAVEHMETANFCGATCHVMQPEFRAYQAASHGKVGCVECHVAPGASGWIDAKMAGTRQLFEVMMNSHPRPIPSAMETGRLVAAEQTCEKCHDRSKALGQRLRVIRTHAEDAANTPSYTVLLMQTGGIHGAHLDPDVEISYTAADRKRQTLPLVEWRNRKTGETREYLTAGAAASQTRFRMQCVDCHNRPAHSFERPERAVDEAIASGAIPANLPFVKKHALALLRRSFASQAQAAEAMQSDLTVQYAGQSADAKRAAAAVKAIYQRNVFPDLAVTWGTYPDNLGHANYPGCFRCHDGDHKTKDGKTIGQDCGTCHEALAVDEADPEILRKLNIPKKL